MLIENAHYKFITITITIKRTVYSVRCANSAFVWYYRLEEALEACQAKRRELLTWHERYDILYQWVNDEYVRLGSRPPSPKASFGGIKRQESVIEVKSTTIRPASFSMYMPERSTDSSQQA